MNAHQREQKFNRNNQRLFMNTFRRQTLTDRLLWVGLLFFAVTLPHTLQAQDNETCEMCHDDETMETTIGGRPVSLYVTSEQLVGSPHEGFSCIDCHTDLEGVEDFPHQKNLDLPVCGNCHEEAQKEFIEGFFQPLIDKGYTTIPTCQDCHGKHKVSWVGKPKKVCGICHQDIVREFQNSIHWQDSDDPDITCVTCHNPHFKHEKSLYSPEGWKLKLVDRCARCHEDQVRNYKLSRHYTEVASGNLKAPICSDCHAKHNILSPRNPNSIVSVANLDRTCTRCHEGYERSIHRKPVNDDPRNETCVACHTGHNTDFNAKSLIFDTHVSQVCMGCHEDILESGFGSAHQSIHLKQLDLIKEGKVADCGTCHQYHYRAPHHQKDHALRKECGDCHTKEQADYEKSAHYVSRQKGHMEAPTCVTCHSNRMINSMNETYKGQHIIELCSSCHGDRNITMKFQLNPNVVEGYNSSYHGQIYALGYQGEQFATCVSCHDNHSILPSDQPESTISKENIMKTCGKCHEDVNENFVGYLQHYSPMAPKQNKILRFIDVFMKGLLLVTLVIFGTHTLLWFIRLMIHRVKNGPLKHENPSGRYVKRFHLIDRISHVVMIMGFLTLAFTGLPLKYSHTRLANWLVHNIVGFRTAAILHRSAAITLGLVFLAHILNLLYKTFVKKQKGMFWGPKSLVPNLQDVKDFIHHMLYFVGMRKDTPKFGRWTYWEKFDYFAVFWGMIVIGLSGITLMIPEVVTRILPGWMINAAHIIHSEEALLATAFIFIVHFFNTHLRPGSFPMDDVIFSGRMPESKFLEERPLEKDMIAEEEKLEDYYVKPLSTLKSDLIFLMGYFFLFVGLGLLILIIMGSFYN